MKQRQAVKLSNLNIRKNFSSCSVLYKDHNDKNQSSNSLYIPKLDVNTKIILPYFFIYKHGKGYHDDFILEYTLPTIAAKVKDAVTTFDQQPNQNFSIFIILCVKPYIMFLEFYNNIEQLDIMHISHYKGFIPLTRPVLNHDRPYEFDIDILDPYWLFKNRI